MRRNNMMRACSTLRLNTNTCRGSVAPFGLDGLGNVAAKDQRVRCGATLPPAARLSSRRARERERGVESSAQEDQSWRRAMQKATIEPITALGSARCVRIKMASCTHVPPPKSQDSDLHRPMAWFTGAYVLRVLSWTHVRVRGARRMVWGPRAGVGIRGGLNILRALGQPQGEQTEQQNHKLLPLSRRLGLTTHASTEVSALPRVHLHSARIFVRAPIIRFWGARRIP
jgi:hypothetical protein